MTRSGRLERKGLRMSDTVSVAMIGLGFGAEFIPIYQSYPQANVHAICQRNEVSLNKEIRSLDVLRELKDAIG